MTRRQTKLVSYFIIGLFIFLTGAFAWQAQYFQIDASADTLLVKDNKHYLESQKAYQRYEPEDFILIAYEPKTHSIFTPAVLNRIDKISSLISKIERVKSVRSLVNVPIFLGMDSLTTGIEPSSLTWKKRTYSPEFLHRVLKNHPLYENLLVNEEQTALSMQVVFKIPPAVKKVDSEIAKIQIKMLERELTEKENLQLAKLKEKQDALGQSLDKKKSEEIEKIRNILKPFEDTGSFYLGGNSLLAHQMIQIIKNDLIVFGSAITLIISLILFFLFRRKRWVFLPLLCCGLSVLITIGLLGTFGLKVTVISANVIALQIILSLAMIIHLIERYRELIETDDDHNQIDLVLSTVKSKAKPCFYAGLTTTIGFGSLVFSGVQPVISFGWMMVAAMVVTILVSLLLFPAILIVFFDVSTDIKHHNFIQKFMDFCARIVLKAPKTIIFLSLAITIIGLIGCLKLTAENSFLNYFSRSTEVYKELSFIDKNFGGSTPFDLLYRIPDKMKQKDLFLTAGAVQQISSIQSKLEKKEAIGTATSIADFTRIAQVVNKKPLTEYELTTLYKLLDEDLKQDLFASYFSEKNHEVRISMRVQDTTAGLDRAQLMDSIHSDLKSLGVDKKDYTLVGLFVLYQDILERLVDSQIYTLTLVYIAMAVMLFFIFGSLKVALIALVPNVMTTAVIMGTMGWFNIPLDLMTMTIAAVAMGISVDDTIHYVHRFLEEIGQSSEEPVRKTHLSVGYALLYTTSVIIIGFVSLVFSDFIPSVMFGVLTSIAMGVALLTDITILPVLMKMFITPTRN